MRQATGVLTVQTQGPGLTEVTSRLAGWLSAHGGGSDGLLTLLCRHTSASLTIQENADPDVQADLETAFDRLAPRDAGWRHTIEGPDDMPAHIRTVLSGVTLSVPVMRGRMALGTWQGIYLWEHRGRPHRREIALHFISGAT